MLSLFNWCRNDVGQISLYKWPCMFSQPWPSTCDESADDQHPSHWPSLCQRIQKTFQRHCDKRDGGCPVSLDTQCFFPGYLPLYRPPTMISCLRRHMPLVVIPSSWRRDSNFWPHLRFFQLRGKLLFADKFSILLAFCISLAAHSVLWKCLLYGAGAGILVCWATHGWHEKSWFIVPLEPSWG